MEPHREEGTQEGGVPLFLSIIISSSAAKRLTGPSPLPTTHLLLLTVTGPRTALSRVLLGVGCVGEWVGGEGWGTVSPPCAVLNSPVSVEPGMFLR